LLLHYPIQKKTQSEEYYFKTDKGVFYEVYFSETTGYFPINTILTKDIQLFGFYSNTKIGTFDPLVSNSIVKIITDYFALNPNAVLLFAYDQSGGKQDSRKRLFKRWFDAYASGEFYKMDLKIEGIDYASAIFLNQNIHKAEIISMLKALTSNIESK